MKYLPLLLIPILLVGCNCTHHDDPEWPKLKAALDAEIEKREFKNLEQQAQTILDDIEKACKENEEVLGENFTCYRGIDFSQYENKGKLTMVHRDFNKDCYCMETVIEKIGINGENKTCSDPVYFNLNQETKDKLKANWPTSTELIINF